MTTAAAPRDFLATLFAGAPPEAAAALTLAASHAQAARYVVLPLGVQPATEARELASVLAAIAQQSLRHGRPMAPTLVLCAGPVLRGGQAAGAAELALALALSLDEHPAIHAGVAGPAPPGQDALFLLAPDTVRRAAAAGTPAAGAWRAATAAAWFAGLGASQAVIPAPQQVLCAVLITQD